MPKDQIREIGSQNAKEIRVRTANILPLYLSAPGGSTAASEFETMSFQMALLNPSGMAT
jgi:hypothetical protein